MAITKILHMKSGNGGANSKHLARCLNYVLNPEKTQNGRLVGAVNCQADKALDQFRETKRLYGKTDKRQGYHIIISFKENEATPETAFEITRRFTEQYLGRHYEAVYSVHDNTDHIHSHIVFNSVRFDNGKKYHYQKGDWAKHIQPITNKLCEEYGLSTINIETEQEQFERLESRRFNGRSLSWKEMICLDIDACIMLAPTYETFIAMIIEKGYEVKNTSGEGKYPAIRPPGRKRFRRLNTLGDNYSEERIRERLLSDSLNSYNPSYSPSEAEVAKHDYVKRHKRAPLSGIQKEYYAKLYRTGQLKKRAYSQAWKYKADIEKMQQLEKQYHFLIKYDVRTETDLDNKILEITDQKKKADAEKSRAYRAERKNHAIFGITHEMIELDPARIEFESGDDFFKPEHEKWSDLKAQLEAEGYTFMEAVELEKFHKTQKSLLTACERELYQDLKTGREIKKDLISGRSNIQNGEQKKSTTKESNIEIEQEKNQLGKPR